MSSAGRGSASVPLALTSCQSQLRQCLFPSRAALTLPLRVAGGPPLELRCSASLLNTRVPPSSRLTIHATTAQPSGSESPPRQEAPGACVCAYPCPRCQLRAPLQPVQPPFPLAIAHHLRPDVASYYSPSPPPVVRPSVSMALPVFRDPVTCTQTGTLVVEYLGSLICVCVCVCSLNTHH